MEFDRSGKSFGSLKSAYPLWSRNLLSALEICVRTVADRFYFHNTIYFGNGSIYNTGYN